MRPECVAFKDGDNSMVTIWRTRVWDGVRQYSLFGCQGWVNAADYHGETNWAAVTFIREVDLQLIEKISRKTPETNS